MKVLNLQCSHQHFFEGWFASEDDFQSQLLRGLIECPMCADKIILKMPSAPRLNLGGHRAVDAESATDVPPVMSADEHMRNETGSADRAATSVPAMADRGPSPAAQAAFLKALRQVVRDTEDVGARFADEARRMHYGDIKARNIRGEASMREAAELMEEGIEVMPLPMPAAIKETLQ